MTPGLAHRHSSAAFYGQFYGPSVPGRSEVLAAG